MDHAFEAVGLPMLVSQAVRSLAIHGTATLVGVLPAGSSIEFPWEALRPECRLQTSRMGSNAFRFDIPNYLELYDQGRLRLDEMIHPPHPAGRHQRRLPRDGRGGRRAQPAGVRLEAEGFECRPLREGVGLWIEARSGMLWLVKATS